MQATTPTAPHAQASTATPAPGVLGGALNPFALLQHSSNTTADVPAAATYLLVVLVLSIVIYGIVLFVSRKDSCDARLASLAAGSTCNPDAPCWGDSNSCAGCALGSHVEDGASVCNDASYVNSRSTTTVCPVDAQLRLVVQEGRVLIGGRPVEGEHTLRALIGDDGIATAAETCEFPIQLEAEGATATCEGAFCEADGLSVRVRPIGSKVTIRLDGK